MLIRSLFLALAAILVLNATAQSVNALRTPGEVIWTETFDADTWSSTVVDGLTVVENLPTGWTFTDATNNSFYWTWSQEGPKGKYTSPNGGAPRINLTSATPILSETGTTGFLLLPSDWYNTNEDGTLISPSVPMDASFQFGTLDFSNYTAVHFKMQYFFKILHDDGAFIYVEFSNDGGNTWLTHPIQYTTNVPSGNPATIDIDLTEQLAGYSDCYFRISQVGSTHYFFMIDDISFYQPLDYDLRIENFWADYSIAGPLGNTSNVNTDYFGGYKNIPLGVAAEFKQFRIAAINFGGIDRVGVYANMQIENLSIPQINPVYENQSEFKVLPIGQRDTLTILAPYQPNNYGTLQFTSMLTDGENDESALNIAQSIVNITETFYSYTDTATASSYNSFEYSYSADVQGVGQFFLVPDIEDNTIQFTKVGFYLHAQSQTAVNAGGIEIEGRLLKKEGTSYTLLQTTDSYAPVSTDPGSFVELVFTNPLELEGNTDYLLLIHVTKESNNNPFKIGIDANHRQSYGRSGVVLGAENLTIISQTPAMYAVVSGGYIPKETDILSFTIDEQVGETEIDNQNKTITVTMPIEYDLNALSPEFILSLGASAAIDDVAQESGVSVVDFTTSVLYTITNIDNETLWTITVQNEPEPEAEIIDFLVFGQQGQAVIDSDAQTVDVTVAFGTNVSVLMPTFTLSEGSSAFVGEDIQISGETILDFSNPVIYTVYYSNGEFSKEWVVTVTIAEEPSMPSFVAFSVANQIGTTFIVADNQTISLAVSEETDITQIIPTFQLTPNSTAFIGQSLQESGVSIVDFTNPVIYRVTDGVTNVLWTVTISTQLMTGNSILNFSVPEQLGQTVINPASKSIVVAVDNGADIMTIVPTFELSQGATAYVNSQQQISGSTEVDFTNVVPYSIVSQSGQSATWMVKVAYTTDLLSETDILSFGFSGQTQPAVIDNQEHTINVNISGNQNSSNLIPVFALSTGATAYVGSEMIVSGGSIVNFTTTVTMKVLAQNTVDYQDWTINVTSTQNQQANFETFYVEFDYDEDGTMDTTFNAAVYQTNNKIELHLPAGTILSDLTPKWTVSDGASVSINDEIQESGVSVVNMGQTLNYMVTSQGGSFKLWNVYTYADIVGVEHQTIAQNVQFYPNPASTEINIQVPEDMRNGSYIIYNIYGQTVKSDVYRGLSFDISIHELPRGIYFVKVVSDRYQKLEKMLFR